MYVSDVHTVVALQEAIKGMYYSSYSLKYNDMNY